MVPARTAAWLFALLLSATLVAAESSVPSASPAAETSMAPTLAETPGVRFLRINERGFEEYLWEKDRAEMILVPESSFPMGRTNGEWSERPVRTVTLGAYLIDKYEVTVAQYGRFLASFEHRIPPRWEDMERDLEKKPVVMVSWHDASQYAFWTGKRLPTEAQWERAAAGEKAQSYPWGATAPKTAFGNFDKVGNRDPGQWSSWLRTVGQFPKGASAIGALDMAGNVAEWCHDWYAPTAYRVTPTRDPEGVSSGHEKVVRGGSFLAAGHELSSQRRSRADAQTHAGHLGFRSAVPVSEIAAAVARVASSAGGVVNEYQSDSTRTDEVQAITPVKDAVKVKPPTGAPTLEGFLFHRVNSRGGLEYTFERDRYDFVLVPQGTFTMGSADRRERCEGPAHSVEMSAFLISKYEVGVDAYAKFLRATSHPAPPNWAAQRVSPEHPVAWVSHADAAAYAAWAKMRLPTEAEWEYAARGSDARLFPWGSEPPSEDHAQCGGEWRDDPYVIAAEVSGRYPKGQSPFGVYDLGGNLWEWTDGWFGCGYPDGPRHDPTGEPSGRRRVARGGSWREECGDYHKATTRMSFFPQERLNHLGFRVVKPLPAPVSPAIEPDTQ